MKKFVINDTYEYTFDEFHENFSREKNYVDMSLQFNVNHISDLTPYQNIDILYVEITSIKVYNDDNDLIYSVSRYPTLNNINIRHNERQDEEDNTYSEMLVSFLFNKRIYDNGEETAFVGEDPLDNIDLNE